MTADRDSDWRSRPTYVTGGTGVLGGVLVAGLLDRDADVVCLIRDSAPECELVRSGNIGRVRVVHGDVADQELHRRVISEYEVDTVFHLAAQTVVGTANLQPSPTFDTNVRGTWCVLEAARNVVSVRAVVVASSDKAYGAESRLPYDETMPMGGRHMYDVSKSCADLIAQAYGQSYGLPVAITRCGNLYGGGDLNWNRLVPGTIRSLLRGERPIVRSDGTFQRDYLYVKDAVSAYMLLADAVRGRPGLAGTAFNFSNGEPRTVFDVIGALTRLMDLSLEPDVRSETVNEIHDQYLCSDRSRTVLGWKPGYSLETGLGETIEWYRGLLADSPGRRRMSAAHARPDLDAGTGGDWWARSPG